MPELAHFNMADVEWASRCPSGTCLGLDGKYRKAGQFMPFYVHRGLMPQVNEQYYPKLIDWSKSSGVPVETRVFDPDDLCAHQRVVWAKVYTMSEEALRKPILVSKDRFVLDGNHRWRANMMRGNPVHAYEFGVDFPLALDLLLNFPDTYRYVDGPQPERN